MTNLISEQKGCGYTNRSVEGCGYSNPSVERAWLFYLVNRRDMAIAISQQKGHGYSPVLLSEQKGLGCSKQLEGPWLFKSISRRAMAVQLSEQEHGYSNQLGEGVWLF